MCIKHDFSWNYDMICMWVVLVHKLLFWRHWWQMGFWPIQVLKHLTPLKYNENCFCKVPKRLMDFFYSFCVISGTSSLKSRKHINSVMFFVSFPQLFFHDCSNLSFRVIVLIWGPCIDLFLKVCSFSKMSTK